MAHLGPTDVTAMSPERMQVRYGEMTTIVLGFYNRLTRLSLDAWIAVASADTVHHRLPVTTAPDEREAEVAADAAARARLRSVMDTMPSAVLRVRRRIQEITSVASGFAHPTDVARMNRVALTAGLAIVARPQLEEDEFARLYRPFRAIIPVDELLAGA